MVERQKVKAWHHHGVLEKKGKAKAKQRLKAETAKEEVDGKVMLRERGRGDRPRVWASEEKAANGLKEQ